MEGVEGCEIVRRAPGGSGRSANGCGNASSICADVDSPAGGLVSWLVAAGPRWHGWSGGWACRVCGASIHCPSSNGTSEAGLESCCTLTSKAWKDRASRPSHHRISTRTPIWVPGGSLPTFAWTTHRGWLMPRFFTIKGKRPRLPSCSAHGVRVPEDRSYCGASDDGQQRLLDSRELSAPAARLSVCATFAPSRTRRARTAKSSASFKRSRANGHTLWPTRTPSNER